MARGEDIAVVNSAHMESLAGYFLSYYELHEISWNIKGPVRLQDAVHGTQFHIGTGPFWIPDMASARIRTHAGGATLEAVNDITKLEGGTFFGIGRPVSSDSASIPWNEFKVWADDCAALVGLCLNQRFALQKRAQYVKHLDGDGSPRRESFMWDLFAGGRASVSERSTRSLIRAFDRLASGRVRPATLTALRWYEQSKRVTIGADRLVALWIALEALMPQAKAHDALVKLAAQELARPTYRLSARYKTVRRALGLDIIRRCRNAVIHEGLREVPWPVADDAEHRDWPQILNDVVAEILRDRFTATKTREVNRHFAKGLELVGADIR